VFSERPGDQKGEKHEAFREQFGRFLSAQRSFEVEAGEAIFHQGSPLSSALFLQAGVVKREFLVPAGKHFLLDLLGPPHLINLTLMEPTQQVSASAVEPVTVASVPLPAYLDWLGENPDRWRFRLQQYARLVQKLQRRIGLLAYYGVRERLLVALLELMRVWTPAEDNSVTIPLQGQDLAEMVGGSRETVVRELGVLKQRGLLQVGHRHVTMLDVTVFRTYCQNQGLELP